MDERIVRVADHQPAIDRALAHYGLAPETLVLVPSVFDWCAANDVVEDNVGRMAKCFYNWDNGTCRIVMCDTLPMVAFESANTAMSIRGFFDEVSTLTSDKLCLLHLLLHEIACHVLRTTEQEARDAWAFSEMAIHEI